MIKHEVDFFFLQEVIICTSIYCWVVISTAEKLTVIAGTYFVPTIFS